MEASIRRRRLLQATGAGIIVGTTGQVTASRPPTANPSGVVEDVRYRHGWAHVAIANPDDTDAVRLINPHGQQIAQQSLDLAETVASFDLLAGESYTDGRFTVETLSESGDGYTRLGRGAFACAPSLEITGLKCDVDGWPQLHVTNSGSGPADILGVRCGSGFLTPGVSQLAGDSTPIDPGTTLLLEFHTDSLAPTMTTKQSERDSYAGTEVNAEISLDTVGFGIFETTLPVSWSAKTGKRERTDNPDIYYCNTVKGGDFR
jgi:hypothetical protein